MVSMIVRWMLATVYCLTAILLGDWTLRTEISYEATSHPLPIALLLMAAPLLLFAIATVTILLKPYFGIRAGLLACIVAARLPGTPLKVSDSRR